MSMLRWGGVVILGLALVAPARGAEQGEGDRQGNASGALPPSEAQITEWIKLLDADKFEERQQAASRLLEAGPAAASALAQAAESGSLEVTVRAFDILRTLYQSERAEHQEAARQVLQRLAESTNPAAARRAETVLRPPPPADAAPFGGQIGGQIQIQVGAGGPVQVMQLQVGNAQAARTVELVKDGKRIKIEDAPGRVRVTVTEKVDGQEKTTSYEAKSAEELQKKHPAAYELYKRHLPAAPAVGVVQAQAVAAVAPIVGAPAANQAAQQKALARLDETVDRLERAAEAARRKLDAVGKENAAARSALEELLEQVEAARREVATVRKSLAP